MNPINKYSRKTFKGNCWVAVQDISGFTALSERLARFGKSGTEQLTLSLTDFFREADKCITDHRGRIFKLAGDAFYAIFPGRVTESVMNRAGKELLRLPSLDKAKLKARFVAVRGSAEARSINLRHNAEDLLIRGPAIYELNMIEENTPAGQIRIVAGKRTGHQRLLDFSYQHRVGTLHPAHRPLFIIFLQVPDVFLIVEKISDFIRRRATNLVLQNWVPQVNTFTGMILAGYPISSGKESEICADLYYNILAHFKHLDFKMGVSTGLVYTGEFVSSNFSELAVLGDRVNVAARLCAGAPNRGMYVSSELVGSLKGRYRLQFVGSTTLKGKTEKIKVFKPVEQIASLFDTSLFPYAFVGRQHEIKRAVKLIKKKKNIVIIGDAGLGKSRMLFELRKIAKINSAVEIGLSPFMLPLGFLQSLIINFPHTDYPELDEFFTGKTRIPHDRLIGILRHVFDNARATLVLIEDLHWVDEASMNLIRQLIPLPFKIIASMRPEGINAVKTMGLISIELGNLSRQYIANLSTEIIGDQPDKVLLDYLWNCSQGNPFYCEQILLDLKEKKHLIKKRSLVSVDKNIASLPLGIHSILLSRFERLPETARSVLEFASCIGREFDPVLLRSILGRSVRNFQQGVDEGILLKTGELYLFRHALFREAILSSLLESSRRHYELMIGQAMIKLRWSAYETAYHLTEAGETLQALPFWKRAFYEFYDRGLDDEMQRLISKLLDEVNPDKYKIGVFLQALYCIRKAKYRQAETKLNNLMQNIRWRNYTLMAKTELHDWSGQYDKMFKTLKEIRLAELDNNTRLEYLESWGIYYDMTGSNKKALDYYKQGYRLAAQMKMQQALHVSLYNIGWVYFKDQRFKTANSYFQRALNLIQRGELFPEGTVLLRLGQIAMYQGEMLTAESRLHRALENFKKIDFVYWISIAHNTLANYYSIVNNEHMALKHSNDHDRIAQHLKMRYRMIPFAYLHFNKFKVLQRYLKNKKDEYPEAYFLYLCAVDRQNEAIVFAARHPSVLKSSEVQSLSARLNPLNYYTLRERFYAS